MRPRSDVVARRFLDGDALSWIGWSLNCSTAEVEAALRRAFVAAEKRKRGRR